MNGPDEVKNHPWLRDYNFNKLINKEVDAPFVPNSKDDNFHVSNRKNSD